MVCHPSILQNLWECFKDNICNDLHHHLQVLSRASPSNEDVHDYGLYLINNILLDAGFSLCDFPHMPLPQRNWA